MIAKISSGKSMAGLIRYLYGPGRANEHTDIHLVASWDGFAPDPGRADDITAARKQLVDDLDLRVKQADRLGRAPKQHVWHCSLRAAPGDRILDDGEWADIARRAVAATGIAPVDDPDGCRWITAPPDVRTELHSAASAFERATRSRVRAEHHHARALRGAVKAILREPAPKDGAALAMFLDAALLAVIAAARWHDRREHEQQVVAAHKSLLHLQAAYDHTAATPLLVLGQRRPSQNLADQYVRLIRQAAPAHADQILADSASQALTTALAKAEAAGHDPKRLLQQAAEKRALDDARSPACTITWRVHRLSQRPAPSRRALAAQARSTGLRHVPSPEPAATAPPTVLASRPRRR